MSASQTFSKPGRHLAQLAALRLSTSLAPPTMPATLFLAFLGRHYGAPRAIHLHSSGYPFSLPAVKGRTLLWSCARRHPNCFG